MDLPVSSQFIASILFIPEDKTPTKRPLTFNSEHDVNIPKGRIFITTAVRA
jgi:hypothetical protein